MQPEATAEGRGDQVESKQEAPGAAKRGTRHSRLVASLRAKHSQQARQAQHPQTKRQLP